MFGGNIHSYNRQTTCMHENNLHFIRQHKLKSSQYTRNLIMQMFKQENASGLKTTTLRVSLLCPVGKIRIKTPSRFDNCQHVQCFDAMTFLRLNRHRKLATCPICCKKDDIGKLHVDSMFLQILSSVVDCDQVEFYRDGTWTEVSFSDVVKSREVEVIDLTVSSDED